ncbi:hypothetical protein BH11MYX3_BH11MYX3_20410 [soil metagenome]
MSRRLLSVLCVLAGCGNDRAITGPDDPEAAAVVPARVRLLTDAQYTHAVHDLLGATIIVPDLESPGTHPDQFIHDDVLAVDAPLLVQYRIAAETIAHQLETELEMPCVATDLACAQAWVEDVAGRAFRRPLESVEREQLNALYTLGRASGERSGYALVAEAVLQAPSFVYRTELGAAPGTAIELTPHELAAELSFLFLDSIPDAELWRAANDSTLADHDVLEAQVDRLLETPRVRTHLTEVVLDWLGVPGVLTAGKDELVFPELTPELRRSMYAETEAFVSDVLWRRDGSLRELLTSNQTFVDAPLAELYGVTTRPMQMSRITLDHARRGGILTQASILTTLATEQRESIIRRGMFVRRTFLCLPDPGRPPFAAIVAESGFTHAMTESQFSFFRGAHVYCSGCHASIDPAGRALHHYDGIGRWRDVDEIASPVESDAVLEIGGIPTRITDAVNLGRVLAESDHVARCVVDQLANHAFGRKITDPKTQAFLHDRFEDSGHDLVDVFRTLATSAAFRYRRGDP